MCEFILIVFIAVSVLMPKLCFRQRLLKLWSLCKKHPWNESHSLSNQFVQNVNTHWYPENRAGVVNAYLSTVIPISDIHFFTRKKTSAASVVLKKILNSVSWKWKLNISTPQSPCAHQEAPKLLWQQPWSCVTGVHEKPLLRPFAVFLTCSSKPNLASEVRPLEIFNYCAKNKNFTSALLCHNPRQHMICTCTVCCWLSFPTLDWISIKATSSVWQLCSSIFVSFLPSWHGNVARPRPACRFVRYVPLTLPATEQKMCAVRDFREVSASAVSQPVNCTSVLC